VATKRSGVQACYKDRLACLIEREEEGGLGEEVGKLLFVSQHACI
jgi:hypothetical protein